MNQDSLENNIAAEDFSGLWEYVRAARPAIEAALLRHLPVAPASSGARGERFNEALRYALFPGGKRLRPALTLLGAEIVGGRRDDVLSAAAAVEFVHTSSLIFDDLPCMDDARERRGRTALHRVYGEGLAVLVALNLMNASYALVFEGTDANTYERAVCAHREIVNCIGASGMVTGQNVDLAHEDERRLAVRADANANVNNAFALDDMRHLKTSALMRMALRLGAVLSDANERQLAALSRFAELLGEAYQLSDDLIDLREDAALASDARIAQTFAAEHGERAAQNRLSDLTFAAKGALRSEFGASAPAARLLCQMAEYAEKRVPAFKSEISVESEV